MNNEEVTNKAIDFNRKNKKRIAQEIVDQDKYISEDKPVSVFMAGSPGAGKTESSKRLLEDKKFLKKKYSVLRIDPDELRDYFSQVGYTGGNSSYFNGAVSILVDVIHDKILKKGKSFVLDGTFSKVEIARKNVERSLRRGRFV